MASAMEQQLNGFASEAVDAFLSGGAGESAEEAVEEEATEEEPEADPGEETEAEGEGAEGEEESAEESDEESSKKLPRYQEVRVNDGTGKRTIKVDFNDREQLIRYVQQAHGAMKMYRRAKDASSRAEQAESKLSTYEEKAKRWDELEELFASEGEEAVIERILQKPIDALVEERLQTLRWLSDPKTTPEQKAEYYRQQAEKKAERAIARAKRKEEEIEARRAAAEQQAEIVRLQSMVNPIFEKYRFAGKLGNEAREHRMDTLLWNEMQRELDELRKSGVQSITPAIVAEVLRDLRDTFGGTIQEQAAKQVKKTADVRKAKAQRAAASAARRSATDLGTATAKSQQEFDPLDTDQLISAMYRSMSPRRRR